MKPLSSITRSLSQSDIRSVTARVNAVNGINLGQGICDMPTPDPIKEAAKKAIDNDKSIYAPFGGIDSLRQQIVDKVQSFNKIPIENDQNILVTNGSTGAFVTAVFASFKPLRDRPGFANDQKACTSLIDAAGVGSVTGRSFYTNPEDGKYMLRFCFAKKEHELEEACQNIENAFG